MVLLLQIHRIPRHGKPKQHAVDLSGHRRPETFPLLDILRSTQEIRSHIDAPRDPPRHHAHVGVVRCQVHAGRPFDVLRLPQHFRPHHHVHVLSARRSRAAVPEVSVVEEVSDYHTDGKGVSMGSYGYGVLFGCILQIQFVLVMVHAFQLLFIDCNYPKAFVWWIGMHAVMFYFLFSNFYNETYKKKQDKLKAEVNKTLTI